GQVGKARHFHLLGEGGKTIGCGRSIIAHHHLGQLPRRIEVSRRASVKSQAQELRRDIRRRRSLDDEFRSAGGRNDDGIGFVGIRERDSINRHQFHFLWYAGELQLQRKEINGS